MRPLPLAIAGVLCLVLAQVLWFAAIAPRRPAPPAAQAGLAALPPGEFAGTLLLGGFRGLACDLLWMRAGLASQNGRQYESIALYQAIGAVQPRFAQVWEHLAWDLAYNRGFEAEGAAAKFAWYLAGIEANVRGLVRNPASPRLLNHLAWMLNHKGDDFHTLMLERAWGPLLDPVLADGNAVLSDGLRVPPIGESTGMSGFALAARLYTLAGRIADARGEPYAHGNRRMVPLCEEFDGNVAYIRGEHLRAVRRWIDALDAWDAVGRWEAAQPDDPDPYSSRSITRESRERNAGRLRRRVVDLLRRLAPDAALAAQAVRAVEEGRWDAARAALAAAGWRTAIPGAAAVWLDEGRRL